MAKRSTTRAKRMPEDPTCNCILLCEDVLVSAGRGKHMLHGVIGQIAGPTLPIIIGPTVAYIRLGNVYGQQTVKVAMERDEDSETLFAFEAKLDGQKDPLGLHILVVPIPALQFTAAGRYRFEVAGASGIPLAASPILVVAVDSLGENQ